MKITRTHVLGVVAVLALAGAGAAFAVSRAAEERAAHAQRWHGGGFPHRHRGPAHLAVREAFAAAADYVGLPPSELVSRLRQGQSLAQIAEAEGKSVDGLQGAIREALTARLDALIEDFVHRARAPRT